MTIEQNKMVTATYDLYVDGKLLESATAENPFVFCYGIGMTLPKFEEQMAGKNEGDDFDFSLPFSDAYGEYDENGKMQLERALFETDGKMDTDVVYEGNIVPMMTADGERFNAKILKVTDTHVHIDMNHPLAGKDLHFTGKIMSVRDASEEELKHLTQGGGCGGGCHCGDGGCNCEGDCGGCC